VYLECKETVSIRDYVDDSLAREQLDYNPSTIYLASGPVRRGVDSAALCGLEARSKTPGGPKSVLLLVGEGHVT
jgi:hypothetical protein